MGGDSSASASNPPGLGDIPLIWCTECGSGQVLRRISRKPWSAGQVFYCCTKYKQDGTGCSFWYWEDDYLDKLGRQGSENRVRTARMQGDWSNSRKGMVVNKDVDLVGIVKELVTFVKAICLLLLCILFVLVLILVVQLIK
ncbi:unnamed protein product [Urochloa humidicola]